MGCILFILALLFPRVVIIILALLTTYMSRAYDTLLWPVLGFIFMPFTTLAYALAMNSNNGSVAGLYLVIVVVAVLVDLGFIGGGSHSARNRERK